YPRKIKTPKIVYRHLTIFGSLGDYLPRKGNFHAPALIPIRRVVQGTPNIHCRSNALYIPTIQYLSTIAIGLGQEKVPQGVMGVHLIFVIIVGIPIGIYKDFEIVIVKNNGIALL